MTRKSFSYAIATIVTASIAGLAISGCAVGSADDTDSSLGESASAFGEAACGTNTPDVTNNDNLLCGHFGTGNESPTSAYGTTSCTNAWIVEYPNADFHSNSHVEWADTLPSGATGCGNSFIKIDTFDSSGTLIATASNHGTWSGTSCSFPLTFATLYNGTTAAGSRAVVQAFHTDLLGTTFFKVRAIMYENC